MNTLSYEEFIKITDELDPSMKKLGATQSASCTGPLYIIKKRNKSLKRKKQRSRKK